MSTELNIIERSLDTFKDAALILSKNKDRAAKATAIGNKILADLQTSGGRMTPEMDARMKNYLMNCSNAVKGMNEDRKPITQTLTIIAREFTGQENLLDAANKETVAYKIQQVRNAYAEQMHREEQARQEQIRKDQAKAQEVINLKAECEKRLIKHTSDHLNAEKQRVNTRFNAITLENFDEESVKLDRYTPIYPYSHYSQFAHGLTSRLVSAEEIGNIAIGVMAGRFDDFAATYKSELIEVREHLIDRLPSKKKELEAIRDAADELEKDRLKQQQLDREEEDRARIAREDRQKAAAQTQQVDSNLAINTTMSLFETEAAVAESETVIPAARQGYEIEVLGAAGWMQIFQLWFNEEGIRLTNDKIASKKMESMKAFCEKHAHATGIRITSNFLVYTETFKAVNRK